MRNRTPVRNLCAVLLIAGLLAPLASFARLGGGNHFHGSSHSFSHSSSSHHSYTPHSYSHSYGHSYSGTSGCSGFGDVLVLLIIVAIIIAIVRASRARQTQDQDVMPTSDDGELQAWVAALKSRDPAFDLQAFYRKVADVFLRAQTAWSARELEPVRPLMSDATFQRFVTQLGLMKDLNVRNVVGEVAVEQVQLSGLSQNDFFDTVHVAIRARAKDADLPWDASDEQVQRALQKAPSDRFVELWSFVRKPGTQSKGGQDLLHGKCPNCGAPFGGGAANKCEYCNAIVNSGNYDWTLSEITQSSEADSVGSDEVPGLDELREVDPAFNLEILEDRASLIFWKWIEAQSHADARKVAKLASADFVTELGQQLGAWGGGRRVFRECAVGAVSTDLLELDGEQRAEVEILWSAQVAQVMPGQSPGRGRDETRRTVFLLTREKGAKTRTENGLSTNRCPSCNAPLTDSLSAQCDYCGAKLGAGQDWELRQVRDEPAEGQADERLGA